MSFACLIDSLGFDVFNVIIICVFIFFFFFVFFHLDVLRNENLGVILIDLF